MRDGFIQRGGFWVIVQSCVMLLVATVGVLDRNRFEPFPFQFTIALSLFVLAAIIGFSGVVTLGKKSHCISAAAHRRRVGAARNLWGHPASPLHIRDFVGAELGLVLAQWRCVGRNTGDGRVF